MPLFALAGLFIVGGVVLSGALVGRLAVFGVAAVALLVAAIAKRTTVALEGTQLSYRAFVGGWSIDMNDVRSVDTPSNYQLQYVSFRTSDQVRRLAPRSFERADRLADALIGLLPGSACTPAALAVLEGIRDKASGDAINRAKWRAE